MTKFFRKVIYLDTRPVQAHWLGHIKSFFNQSSEHFIEIILQKTNLNVSIPVRLNVHCAVSTFNLTVLKYNLTSSAKSC